VIEATLPNSDWQTEESQLGGSAVTHRHWDRWATAWVYSDPGGAWAECTSCGAKVFFSEDRSLPIAPASGRSGPSWDAGTEAARR
jgi:hypothetical protein